MIKMSRMRAGTELSPCLHALTLWERASQESRILCFQSSPLLIHLKTAGDVTSAWAGHPHPHGDPDRVTACWAQPGPTRWLWTLKVNQRVHHPPDPVFNYMKIKKVGHSYQDTYCLFITLMTLFWLLPNSQLHSS